MTRWIVAFAASLALTVVALSFDAEAKASRKKCTPPDKAKSWVCSAKEKCCYDFILGKGTCSTTACM
jgi:hypothetical protein